MFSLLPSFPEHPWSFRLALSGRSPFVEKWREAHRLILYFSIYKEAKPATQSGNWRGQHWRMDWDVLAKGHRWENPLMGWQSSGDFMQGTNIHFHSKEDAIAFAEKQGYEYFVQEPNSRKVQPKAYANNFLYSANKLKHIRTK